MYTTTNVHNVAAVTLSKVRTLWESGGFVRDVTVTDTDGNVFQFTMFADARESLAVAASGKQGDSLTVGEDVITQERKTA